VEAVFGDLAHLVVFREIILIGQFSTDDPEMQWPWGFRGDSPEMSTELSTDIVDDRNFRNRDKYLSCGGEPRRGPSDLLEREVTPTVKQ